MLLLAAGRECTELFESYHAFVSNPARPLKFLNSMEVGACVRRRVSCVLIRGTSFTYFVEKRYYTPQLFLCAHALAGVITGPTEYPMYSPDSKGFYSTLRTRVKV